MDLKNTLCSGFATATFIILAIISICKYDKMDFASVTSFMFRTVPATIVMGFLGRMMGSILDRPKNLADSDYTTDVLKALKKLDKNMTMADLNEKLSPIKDDIFDGIEIEAPGSEKEGKNESSS